MSDNGPPNGGMPPGWSYPSSQMFLPPQANYQSTSTPPEPPGARFDGQMFEVQGVPVLFPLKKAVFHIMDSKFPLGQRDGKMRPYVYFTNVTATDLFGSLGIQTGVREWHVTGSGTFAKSQTILVNDARASKTLEDIGWCDGRGFTSKPVWLEVLE
ncbi:MAG: hypothetical protein Q9166_000778 [cf. Caloplaca sp. 2 TL-2023]